TLPTLRHNRNTLLFLTMLRPPPSPTLFPYTTLFRSPPTSEVTPTTGRSGGAACARANRQVPSQRGSAGDGGRWLVPKHERKPQRSEEHTSELQSRENLVCRLLLEKKNNKHK